MDTSPSEARDQRIGRLGKLLAQAEFATPAGEIDFTKFQSISGDDFVAALRRLNGVIRELPLAYRWLSPNVAVHVSVGGVEQGKELVPPRLEDKPQLLSELFDSAKQLPNRRDAAALLYYGIQAIHPFSDGNGRTGRVLFYLANGKRFDGCEVQGTISRRSQEDQTARASFCSELSNPEKVFFVVRLLMMRSTARELGVPHDFSRSYDPFFANDEYPVLHGLSPLVTQRFLEGMSDRSYCSATHCALLEYAMKNGRADTVSVQGEGKERYLRIESEELLKSIADEDAQKILDRTVEIRAEVVRILIKLFTEADGFRMSCGTSIKEAIVSARWK